MNILIVEDDHIQSDWIMVSLKQALPASNISLIETECEFRARLNEIASHPPDVIVMDIMLRWTNPAPDMSEPPAEVQEQGYFGAGLRCTSLLIENVETRSIPVILYTALEERDLQDYLLGSRFAQSSICFVQKESDMELLIQKIGEFTLR